MIQAINGRGAQVTQLGDIVNIGGEDVCAWCALRGPESKIQAEFADTTGIWCGRGARESFEALLEGHGFTAPALRAAWRFGSLVWDDDRGCLMASTPLVEALLGYGVVAGLVIGWVIQVLDVALLQGLAGWRPWVSLIAASALYGGGGMLAAWAILRPRRIAQRVARILEHGGIE